MKGKEAARRMAAFTRTVAGKATGARAVEWLRCIVATTGVMLSQEGDHVERIVLEVGGTLCATHVDDDRTCAFFGRRREVESAEMLKTSPRKGYRPKSGREAT